MTPYDPAADEIRNMQREERETAAQWGVVEIAIYEFMLCDPITRADFERMVGIATDKYRGRLPDGMIRNLVAATAANVMAQRNEAEKQREAAAKKKPLKWTDPRLVA